MEKAPVIWIEDLANHSILLSPSQIQSKVPTPSNYMKAGGGKKALGENWRL